MNPEIAKSIQHVKENVINLDYSSSESDNEGQKVAAASNGEADAEADAENGPPSSRNAFAVTNTAKILS